MFFNYRKCRMWKNLGERLCDKRVKNKATILNKTRNQTKSEAANMKHKTSSSNHFNCIEAVLYSEICIRAQSYSISAPTSLQKILKPKPNRKQRFTSMVISTETVTEKHVAKTQGKENTVWLLSSISGLKPELSRTKQCVCSRLATHVIRGKSKAFPGSRHFDLDFHNGKSFLLL